MACPRGNTIATDITAFFQEYRITPFVPFRREMQSLCKASVNFGVKELIALKGSDRIKRECRYYFLWFICMYIIILYYINKRLVLYLLYCKSFGWVCFCHKSKSLFFSINAMLSRSFHTYVYVCRYVFKL